MGFGEKWAKLVKSYKLLAIRLESLRNVMYIIVTIICSYVK